MKRLLLIGVAACAFAAMPTLSVSAMPRATASTLVGESYNSVILVHGHGHGHGHMGHGGRGHHYGWAEAAITVGDSQQAGPCFPEAASLGGFFVHGWIVFGGNALFGTASLPLIASIWLFSLRLAPMFRYC